MAKSARLRLQDLRTIHRIVGECRDLGDSRLAWRSHLLDELLRLVGCGIAVENEGVWEPGEVEPLVLLGDHDRGWGSGFDRSAMEAVYAEFVGQGSKYQPMYEPYFEAVGKGLGPALTRADFLPDGAWYRSPYYRDHHSSFPGDATMFCMTPIPRPGARGFLVLVRAAGEPDFPLRARTIVSELHSQVGPLIGGPLAGYDEPSPDDLAPRARQVLRCLLEGDGDKQVAARLGLSRHTVNFYIRRIFAHFGVASRSELMARWIRRGWGLSSRPLDDA